MGMYTELHFNAKLVRDVPQQVIDVLAYMTDAVTDRPSTLPDHPLFETERWWSMLACDSYYFPLSAASSNDFDEIANSWYLRVRSCTKGYDGEIPKFIDWIMPHVSAYTECLGYFRYEEADHPTLIYKIAPKEPDEVTRARADERARIVERLEAEEQYLVTEPGKAAMRLAAEIARTQPEVNPEGGAL